MLNYEEAVEAAAIRLLMLPGALMEHNDHFKPLSNKEQNTIATTSIGAMAMIMCGIYDKEFQAVITDINSMIIYLAGDNSGKTNH